MEIRTTYDYDSKAGNGDYKHEFEADHEGQRIRIQMSSTDGGGWSVNAGDVNAIIDDDTVSIGSSGVWYGDSERLPGQVDFGINAIVIDEEKIRQAKDDLAEAEKRRDEYVESDLEDFEDENGRKPTQADKDEIYETYTDELGWALEQLEEAKKGDWDYAGYAGGPQGYNEHRCLVIEEAERTEALEICNTIADAIRQATKKIYNWKMECRPCDADSSWEVVA